MCDVCDMPGMCGMCDMCDVRGVCDACDTVACATLYGMCHREGRAWSLGLPLLHGGDGGGQIRQQTLRGYAAAHPQVRRTHCCGFTLFAALRKVSSSGPIPPSIHFLPFRHPRHWPSLGPKGGPSGTKKLPVPYEPPWSECRCANIALCKKSERAGEWATTFAA